MLRDVRLLPPLYFPKPTQLTRHAAPQGLAYLEAADYTTATLASTHPSRPRTLYAGPHSLFRALAPKYRLNKAEYLQMYNLRPSTQVMLELVIEEVSLPLTRHVFHLSNDRQAGSRFSEEELNDILEIIQGVFDEDEAQIPAGVEDMQMEKIANKLLGASKKKRRVKRKV
jgi:hypothetical protein